MIQADWINASEKASFWSNVFSIYNFYYEENNVEFFNNNLIRCYNFICELTNSVSEFQNILDEQGQLVTYNTKSGKTVDGYNNKENIYRETKDRVNQDNNIYSYMIFCSIYHYEKYDSTYKNVYFKYQKVLIKYLRFIFLRLPSFKIPNSDQTETFDNADYGRCVFSYINLLKYNPVMYFKIEDKSLLERVYEEIVEYEKAVKAYYLRLFAKETKFTGIEKTSYDRILQIPEMLEDPKANVFAEFSTHSEDIINYVSAVKKYDSQNTLSEALNEFELTFKEILYLINGRFKVDGFFEDDSQYNKHGEVLDHQDRTTKFSGIIVVESYRMMYLVWEYTSVLLKKYEDLRGNKIYLEKFVNSYKADYKDWKYRYLSFKFSKKVYDFNSSFEIKIFEKNHYSYYETWNKVYVYEKWRQVNYAMLSDQFDVYYNSFKEHEDLDIRIPNRDVTELTMDLHKLNVDNNELKSKIQVKDMLIYNLENIDITTYNKYIIYNQNLAQYGYYTLIFFIVIVVTFAISFSIQLGVASVNYNKISSSLNKAIDQTTIISDNTSTLASNSSSILSNLRSVKSSLSTYSSNLSDVHNEVSDITTVTNNLMANFDSIINTNLDGQLVTITDYLTDVNSDLLTSISTQQDTLQNNLTLANADINSNTNDHYDTMMDSIYDKKIAIMNLINNKATDVTTRIDTFEASITPILDSILDKSTDILLRIDQPLDGVFAMIEESRTDVNDRITVAETEIKKKIQIVDDIVDFILDRIVNPSDGIFWRIDYMESQLTTDLDFVRDSIRSKIVSSWINLETYITTVKSSIESSMTNSKDTIEKLLSTTSVNALNDINLMENELLTNTDDKYEMLLTQQQANTVKVLNQNDLIETYLSTLDTELTSLDSRLDAKLTSIQGLIQGEGDKIVTKISDRETSLIALLSDSETDLDALIVAVEGRTDTQLDANKVISETIVDSLTDSSNGVIFLLSEIDSKIP